MLVEFVDSRGRTVMRERVMLHGSSRILTVGRSVKADVTLDDEHVAPFHASLQITPAGGILASDLGTSNGIIVSGKRYHAARDMDIAGGEFQLGRTRLRLRTEHEVLAPEKADVIKASARLRNPAGLSALFLLALTAQVIYSSWLLTPPDLSAKIATLLGATALVLALWDFVWALLSRVMRGEWRWPQHIAISAGAVVLYLILDSVYDIITYAFSLPTRDGSIAWLGAVTLACAVWLHLIHASTLSVRSSVRIAATVALGVLISGYWWSQRPLARDVNYIASSIQLYPPFMRLRTAEPAEPFYKTLTNLRGEADKKVNAAIAQDPDLDDVDRVEEN